METSTKQSFVDATYHQWNEIRQWNGLLIARVLFHENREWKLVDTRDFDEVADRSYQPIMQFHTRDEMWEYIKSNGLNKKIL